MICKNCGNKVNDYDKFCTSCGEYVDKNIEDKINTNKNNRKVKILISVTLLIGLVCIGLYTVLKNKLENTEYISSEYTYFESGLAVVEKLTKIKMLSMDM